MGNTNEQFDQHFREKLDGHREKPSALAWERLESQLPKKSKPRIGIWWAVAASVTALLVAGYSFWPSENAGSGEILLAEKTEIPAQIQTETTRDTPKLSPEIGETALKTEVTTPELTPENKPKTIQKTKPTPTPAMSQAPQNLIAQTEPKSEETPIVVSVPELKTDELVLALPELKTPEVEKTIAQASTPSEDEPLYRVSIYSNGVKKGEEPDKNLITELGKTVGQVEGFLGKVDDGLIGLQDKKDNLFTALTSKKNVGEERR
ncbi:hypothetical protein GCM10009119_23970 [Algoriphagus jejuensis]|uniref:Uncharacterized protein n=1 Tax=Algoriphagus jejuensis TaxID=419934 RepID=A0ABN1N0R7_9BACT